MYATITITVNSRQHADITSPPPTLWRHGHVM